MARTMFSDRKDTKIYRVVLEVSTKEGVKDWWSEVYGPYPQEKTARTQLTRVHSDMQGKDHAHMGIDSYEAWLEEGDISWSRKEKL